MRLVLTAAALAAAICGARAADSFDYYVFTLSWSPGFCDAGGAAKQPSQCARGAGEGFVVHGLWPNRAYGANPEDCGGGGYVSGAALKLTDGVYPDEGLARYEYRKHGTCSGLDPQAYFSAVKTLRDAIVVPETLKAPSELLKVSPAALTQAFIAANANLTADNMAISCRDGELVDVRICVAKNLTAFAQCPKVAGHTCHAASIAVAPPR